MLEIGNIAEIRYAHTGFTDPWDFRPSMLNSWKRKYLPRQRLGHITLAACVLAVCAGLPWYLLLQGDAGSLVLGMETAFFFALFGIPLLAIAVNLIHGRYAEDQERHIRKFENE